MTQLGISARALHYTAKRLPSSGRPGACRARAVERTVRLALRSGDESERLRSVKLTRITADSEGVSEIGTHRFWREPIQYRPRRQT